MATYPQKLGRYVLERRLAAGGMAEVFLARQSGPEGFEKVCVVKRMLPHLCDDEVFVNMFLDEARLAARLTHPNVAQIFDFGRHDDAYYLAMEYVQGSNLHFVVDDHARRLSRMPLPPVLRLTALACAGLDFAHHATDESGRPLNIIHRDISPHNIMLSKNGDVKLIDFGIAKAATGLNLTKAGTLKGKYAYMAPEQVMGRPLDRRTDIYAMGLVLWELLANRPAIIGDSEASLMGAAARREFQAIEQVRPDVPPEVRHVLEKALAKELTDRYDTAAQMADDLEDFLAKSGTRVRQSELAGLLTTSTTSTGVGLTPPTARVMATPVGATLIDEAATGVAPGKPAVESRPSSAPPGKPAVESQAVSVPTLSGEEPGAEPTSPATAPVESPSRRIVPALAAIVLVLAAGGATVFAYLAAQPAPVRADLVVPLPPVKPMVTPSQQESLKPAVPQPVVAAPVQPVSAPPPPLAEVQKPPVAKPAERPVKPVKPAKPVAQPAQPAPAAKGTVMFRVLPYAEVFREGASLGTTPLKPLELEPGKYQFKFVNPETGKSEVRDVTVTSGAQTTVKVDLR